MKRNVKTKKKMGRPSKLTKEIREEIASFLKAGCFIETACVMAGINKTTYYDWMKRGEKSSRYDKYRKFYEAVTHALSWSQARDVAIISKAAEKDWRAAAWKLERRYPEKWGKKKVVETYNRKFILDVNKIEAESNTKEVLLGWESVEFHRTKELKSQNKMEDKLKIKIKNRI
ncbi:MAG: hypothetical protein ACPK7O_05060 [Methanobacterium sp.]